MKKRKGSPKDPSRFEQPTSNSRGITLGSVSRSGISVRSYHLSFAFPSGEPGYTSVSVNLSTTRG